MAFVVSPQGYHNRTDAVSQETSANNTSFLVRDIWPLNNNKKRTDSLEIEIAAVQSRNRLDLSSSWSWGAS